jgi:hypothetical protein
MARFFIFSIVVAAVPVVSCSSDPRSQVRDLAADPVACTQDSDCCVVEDDCATTAYVVASKNADKAASLIASADQSQCTLCMTPLVQVSCSTTGQCVGERIDYSCLSASSSGFSYPGNHCGKLNMPASCAADAGVGGAGGAANDAGAATLEGGAAKPLSVFACGE